VVWLAGILLRAPQSYDTAVPTMPLTERATVVLPGRLPLWRGVNPAQYSGTQ
jgi:hypothetical protein